MHIEKRMIDGVERDVEIEDYQGEHDDREKDRRNMEHADRVASQLAKNKEFIAAIANAILNTPIDPSVGSYTVSIPIQSSGDYRDSDERKGR